MCKNSKFAGFVCLVKVSTCMYMLAMLNSHHVLHIAFCNITEKPTRTIFLFCIIIHPPIAELIYSITEQYATYDQINIHSTKSLTCASFSK